MLFFGSLHIGLVWHYYAPIRIQSRYSNTKTLNTHFKTSALVKIIIYFYALFIKYHCPE